MLDTQGVAVALPRSAPIIAVATARCENATGGRVVRKLGSRIPPATCLGRIPDARLPVPGAESEGDAVVPQPPYAHRTSSVPHVRSPNHTPVDHSGTVAGALAVPGAAVFQGLAAAHALWAVSWLVDDFRVSKDIYSGFRLLGSPNLGLTQTLVHVDFGVFLVGIIWLVNYRWTEHRPTVIEQDSVAWTPGHVIGLVSVLALGARTAAVESGASGDVAGRGPVGADSRTVVETGLPRGTDGLELLLARAVGGIRRTGTSGAGTPGCRSIWWRGATKRSGTTRLPLGSPAYCWAGSPSD